MAHLHVPSVSPVGKSLALEQSYSSKYCALVPYKILKPFSLSRHILVRPPLMLLFSLQNEQTYGRLQAPGSAGAF